MVYDEGSGLSVIGMENLYASLVGDLSWFGK
jgi:hypothetical protein